MMGDKPLVDAEFPWADLTAGTPLKTFIAWFWDLLVRPLSRVPPNVRSAWFVLWFVTALMSWLPRWIFLIVTGLLAALLHAVATQNATCGIALQPHRHRLP